MKRTSERRIAKVVSSLAAQRAQLVLLLTTVIGLTVLKANEPVFERQWLQSAAENIALAGLGIAVLGVVWEVSIRRAFADEILGEIQARFDLTSSLAQEGVIGVTRDFSAGIDWTELIGRSALIDLWWWAGRTWLKQNATALSRAAQRRGFRVRLVLPDTTDIGILESMSRDSGLSGALLHAATVEAESLATQILGDKVELYRSKRVPRYPFMRLGDRVIFGTYSNWVGLTSDRPTFICTLDGPIGAQATSEFEAVLANASRVYPVDR